MAESGQGLTVRLFHYGKTPENVTVRIKGAIYQSDMSEKSRWLLGTDTVTLSMRPKKIVTLFIIIVRVHAYNWWNEALHGVARAGVATVFPQAIAMAATFDAALLQQVADCIATEGRAKYNAFLEKDDRTIYKGLTYWSPNINIFRNLRWGRGHETYGEDPFLTATMGMAFVHGLQGEGEFLKAAACAKHFAVHSGPKKVRHEFDAEVGAQDLYETYLPAFEYLVKHAQVESVMGAYNRVNGEPCCGSKTLLADILRGDWGFTGHVVSDCGAISDFHLHHSVTTDGVASAALALKNGCDLNCGRIYGYLLQVLDKKLISEEDLDTAAIRLMTTRIKLGEFEEQRPYADIPYEAVDSEANRELNYLAACKSLVLLRNEEHFLSLKPDTVQSIAVIGPNALSKSVLEGNYCGTASEYVTVVDGIRRRFPNARLYHAQGAHIYKDRTEGEALPDDRLAEAVTVAEKADITVLCVGLDPCIEGEEGDAFNEYASGDKHNLLLPDSQRRLVKAVCAASDRVVIVTLAGSALDLEDGNQAKAVIHAWYPGAQGGRAIASLLAGDFSPSGKLPVTFYRADNALPDFLDYAMDGRTYRFLKDKPLYPFGYGQSYTTFAYSHLQLPEKAVEKGETLCCCVTVSNTGHMAGDESVQAYARFQIAGLRTPQYQLCSVKTVHLEAGESREVELELDSYWLCAVNEQGERVLPKEDCFLYVGGFHPSSASARNAVSG